ncbi:PREDICTED: glutathione S-transferase T3-like [Camelina sativa]|uniref:Glutathione S-transferase T3-like n=1 Tax=Camelina sativa TaxID=90675 RepID=A0ABM1RSF8_CAMSA|nr:PREDICTED: glutathione S-transferase T3-like [Camelina sativa]
MESNNTPNSQSQSYFSLLNFSYDSFAPNVNIGTSQIPVFSSQTSSQPSQPPSQSEETAEQRRERRIWSTQDDLVLISGWLNTSKDAIVGNGQKSGSFWIRIGDYYGTSSHVRGGAEPRLPDHCRQRWQKISKDVSRFCGAFAEAESEKASGMDSEYDYGINSPLDYSSEEEEEAGSDSVDEYIRLAETTARKCLEHFIVGIVDLFGTEYLR